MTLLSAPTGNGPVTETSSHLSTSSAWSVTNTPVGPLAVAAVWSSFWKIIMNVYYLNNRQTVVWAKVIFDAMRCLFFLSVVSSQKLSACHSRWCNFFHKNNTFDFFNRSSFLIMASCSTVLFFDRVVYCQLLSAFLTNSARLAQWVEHETLNLRVVGSSPTLGVHLFPSATTLFFASKGMC